LANFGKGGLRGISSDLRGDCFGKNLPLPLFFKADHVPYLFVWTLGLAGGI
jgi:hypothetical protein